MNNESAQAKLADLERQIKELKEQLAAQWWVPSHGENYLFVNIRGDIERTVNYGDLADRAQIELGNTYPDTPEGRAAAEHAAFLIGFRARWRRSADVAPGEYGHIPYINQNGIFATSSWASVFGLPKWSTEEKCRAFVDSEGGPERFAEILERGIL